MHCVVQSAVGYYQNVNRRPGWADKIEDAKVFATLRSAKIVVKILHQNHIDAVVKRVSWPGLSASDE